MVLDLYRVEQQVERDRATVDATGRALASKIEGVHLQRLTSHADHRGSLAEIVDVRDPFWSEAVVYAYEFTILPGRIKGWGMHELQADRYFVSGCNVRVVLHDGREDSDTYGRTEQYFFTPTTPGLLKIPPGVWHADQNWGDFEARLINFPTRPYDHTAPDKYRIDPHSGIIPFDWELRDG